MTGGVDPDDYQDAFAPEVSPARRRHLRATEADSSLLYSAVLGALLAVLFGVAGVVVLIAGVLPPHASAAFRLVAGGGCLLAAVLAALSGIRSAAAEWHRRSAEHNGQYVLAGALAERAGQDPAFGDLVRRTQRAVIRIRGSEAFRHGALAGVIDSATLEQAEWTVVSTSYRDGVRADLLRHVSQLEELADTSGRIGSAVACTDGDADASADLASDTLTDDLERANATAAAAAAAERLLSPPHKPL